MLFLPVQNKPELQFDFRNFVYEVPNALPLDVVDRLRLYVNTTDGLHRRGSKGSHYKADFETCLLNDTMDETYKLLDPLWKEYCELYNCQLSFIELYELKKYSRGDFFEPHTDSYHGNNSGLDRKINIIVQLSDTEDYAGGDLMIGARHVPRKKGSAIFFPAFYTHYVTRILTGVRYSLIGHAWGQTWR